MNLDIKIKASLPLIFFSKTFNKNLDKRLQAGAGIVEREYRHQVPVNKNDLRRNVKAIKKSELSWIVTTEAITKDGRSYPTMIHQGTGIYKGQPDSGYHTGRVRASNFYGAGSNGAFEKNLLPLFKMLAKQGKIKGIRPNKFADRTRKLTENQVFRYVFDGVKESIDLQTRMDIMKVSTLPTRFTKL